MLVIVVLVVDTVPVAAVIVVVEVVVGLMVVVLFKSSIFQLSFILIRVTAVPEPLLEHYHNHFFYYLKVSNTDLH